MTAFHTPQSYLLDHETLLGIVRDSPCAVVETALDGTVLLWNRHATEIFGFKPEAVLGKPLPITATDRARAKASREGSDNPLTHPTNQEFETELVGFSGYPVAVSIWHSDLTDSDGKLAAHVSIISDLRDRKDLEMALVESVEAESSRLGRELHDSLSQQLLGAAFAAKALANQSKRSGAELTTQLDELANLINEAVRETRVLSQSLNPIDTEADGLAPALQLLAERTNARIPCTFKSRRPVLVPHYLTASHVYRIAQEASASIASLGGAKSIVISLDEVGDDVMLRVEYEGARNFKDGQFPTKHAVRYRVNAIHGTMHFESKDAHTDALVVMFSKF
ncbi:MAG: histidine kinase [Chthoniobacterales bacterium]